MPLFCAMAGGVPSMEPHLSHPFLADLIVRLNLHRAGREWRGDCPLCNYRDAFVLTIGKTGRPMGWCVSCQDRAGIACLLGGDGAYVRGSSAVCKREEEQRRARD